MSQFVTSRTQAFHAMNPILHDKLQLTTRRTFLGNAGQFSLGAINVVQAGSKSLTSFQ
jgi:hypothetical protein